MTSKPEGIYGFFGDFRFLSNFWVADVEFEGRIYPSTEAAYQAAKTTDLELRKPFEESSTSWMRSGRRAKKLGRELKIRDDWEEVKYDVMLAVVRDKFNRHENLKEMLLITESLYLEETNTWGDQCWGVCKGKGTNHLGKILMLVRDELKNE